MLRVGSKTANFPALSAMEANRVTVMDKSIKVYSDAVKGTTKLRDTNRIMDKVFMAEKRSSMTR